MIEIKEEHELKEINLKQRIKKYEQLLNDSIMLKIMCEEIIDEIPECKVSVKK